MFTEILKRAIDGGSTNCQVASKMKSTDSNIPTSTTNCVSVIFYHSTVIENLRFKLNYQFRRKSEF